MANILITGCNSGLGFAIATQMAGPQNYIYGLDLERGMVLPVNEFIECDLQHPERIDAIANYMIRYQLSLDILINCAGINEINWLEDLTVEQYDRVQAVNSRAIVLLTQAMLPLLIKSTGTVLNIISNASHMPMTASLAYNASKAAAHMITLQLARELTKKYGITVFGISPNKMAGTGMSNYIEGRVPEVRGWSKEKASEYQMASLLTGAETDPTVVAEFIAYLLYNKRNHQCLSGCVIPYGA